MLLLLVTQILILLLLSFLTIIVVIVKALETITELVDNDSNVKVVLKDFPILGPQSMLLAQASIAAYEIDPDKYFKAHQALMNIGRSASREKVITKLSELGYDSVELSKKMDSSQLRTHFKIIVNLLKILE